jgi:transposase
MNVAAPSTLPDLAPELSQLQGLFAAAQTEIQTLKVENQLLRQKLEAFIRRYFGGAKNEQLDPNQLELLLAGLTAPAPAPATPPPPTPPVTPAARSSARPPARSGIPDNLPIERIVLLPAEVQAHPEAFRQIEEVVTRELEWEAARFYWRYLVRPKFVRKETVAATPSAPTTAPLPANVPVAAPPAAPTPQAAARVQVAAVAQALAVQARIDPPEVFIAALPRRLIEKGLPGVGLLVHLLVSRFVDHLPFYRLEQIFRHRHGVPVSRQCMVDWTEQMATWLQPIYRQMIVEARARHYLQADETPICYLDRETPGRSRQGYFWVYGPPGGNVIFEWQTSRGQAGPTAFLKDFTGKLQTDGYAVYASLVQARNAPLLANGKAPELILYNCWAHTRRKFHAAKDDDRRTAWFLRQIGLLYALEKRLRLAQAGPRLRQAARAAEAALILARIQRGLERLGGKVLPQSLLGKAIAYSRERWPHLVAYVQAGEVEIDSNLIENAIRPTAIGKKNFLFIGHPDAGWRSAVIYSIMASCKRYQIDPAKYLKDVLTRLPDMKQSQIPEVTPQAWAKTHPEARTLPPK